MSMAGCAEERIIIEGSITGKDGHALEAAIVTLHYQNRAHFEGSDARGAFRIGVERQPLGVAPLRLAVSAAGHATIETRFPEGGSYRCEITLTEGSSGTARTVVPWALICAKTESSPSPPDTRR